MSQKVVPAVASCLYKSDPLTFRKYVHKYVEIVTIDGEKLYGTVYTIDPVSESVVLVNKINGNTSLSIVMGHAVNTINIASQAEVYTECEELFVFNKLRVNKEDEELRKEKVKSWLLKNRIPVEEKDNMLVIKDALQIYPPYGIEQCISGNEVILGRVQDLILNMPNTADL